jgi:hypothetical protein
MDPFLASLKTRIDDRATLERKLQWLLAANWSRQRQFVRPPVVVLEYNGLWKAEHAVTVPYDPTFTLDKSRSPYYCGASLAAFAKLGRSLGYRFVGTLRTQINAFFVRNDLGVQVLPEVDLRTGLSHAIDFDWGDRPWVEV